MALDDTPAQRSPTITKGERRLASELKILCDDNLLPYELKEQYPIIHLIKEKRTSSVVDFAFPELKILIEVEGRSHLDFEQHTRDCRRHNSLVAKGWTVLRISERQVRKSARTAARYLRHLIIDVLETRNEKSRG